MKRFVLALVSVILLCGCSADKPKEDGINNVTNLTEKVDNTCSADRDYNLVPTIKEANHEDMDIAVYKQTGTVRRRLQQGLWNIQRKDLFLWMQVLDRPLNLFFLIMLPI